MLIVTRVSYCEIQEKRQSDLVLSNRSILHMIGRLLELVLFVSD